MSEGAGTNSLLRFGVFEMCLTTGELRKSGRRVHLAPQPFRLLALLASKPGELVTREDIQRELWADDTTVDFEQGLSFAVKKARAALGDSSHSPRFIETLPRRGYRFIAPVEKIDSPNGTRPISVEAHDPGAPTTQPLWRRNWLIGSAIAAIAAIILALGAGPVRSRIFDKPHVHIHSIAVLPLKNLSGNAAHGFFADSMTDELITDLSRIRALRVIARTSSMTYRGSPKPLHKIARELHVDAVVEGTVEQVGGRVRINVQLVDAATGHNLWAGSYERDAKDVLRLQSEVAEAIADKIQVKLSPTEKQQLQTARTVVPAAQDAYSRGRYLIDQRSKNAILATRYFRKAIRLDPGFASAYAGLSMSLISETFMGQARPNNVMPQARAAARHALQLDPYLGEAYTDLGVIDFIYDWDWKAAKQNLQRGVQLAPSDPLARILYSFYLADVGQLQQAVTVARKALELDPVSFFANRNLAMMLYYDRRYDAALAQLQRTRELNGDPDFVDPWLKWIYTARKMYGKAVNAALLSDKSHGVSDREMESLRHAYDHNGWRGYCKARVKYLLANANPQSIPFMLGVGYVHIGDSSKAFLWLNRAIDQHSIWVPAIAVNPQFDPIRSDPRFSALLERMNLSQTAPIRTAPQVAASLAKRANGN